MLHFLYTIIANLTICAIIGYNVIPIVVYLYQTYATSKSEPKRQARPLDPKSPSSPWVNEHHFATDDDSHSHRKHRSIVDQCSTVTQLFRRIVGQHNRRKCLGYRSVLAEEDERQADGQVVRKRLLSDYQWLTYEEVDSRMESVANGLSQIGVKSGDIVMIYADTRLEWMVTCQAVFRLGATVGTLYTNLGDEGLLYAISQTRVTHLVTSLEFLAKLAKIVDKLPQIKCIVYMGGSGDDPVLSQLFSDSQRQRILFYSYKEVEGMGDEASEEPLPRVQQSGNDTAVLMYTSGSTGDPKGVLISHRNLLFAVKAFYAFAGALTPDADLYCAFLPLAHCLEICAEISFLSVGVPVGYASVLTLTDRSPAVKKGLKGDMSLLRPTVMAAVPLILDRIMKGVTEEMAKRHPLVRLLINGLLNYKSFWVTNGFNTPIINYLICNRFKSLLGGRIRFMASGGAPLRPQTHRFISNLFDVKVLQGL
jgi:long-chain acyl-CoA synthetase